MERTLTRKANKKPAVRSPDDGFLRTPGTHRARLFYPHHIPDHGGRLLPDLGYTLARKPGAINMAKLLFLICAGDERRALRLGGRLVSLPGLSKYRRLGSAGRKILLYLSVEQQQESLCQRVPTCYRSYN